MIQPMTSGYREVAAMPLRDPLPDRHERPARPYIAQKRSPLMDQPAGLW